MTSSDGNLRVLGANDVQSLLDGRQEAILSAVRQAYLAHYEARTSLPHSTFLRFPNEPRNRIIALPAYLGSPFEMAGLKWIASFPGNVQHGLPRASALVVLNDLETGFPTAILEGGAISAKRTAASAALAAKLLHAESNPKEVALVGAGRINAEILSFLRAVFPSLTTAYLFDSVSDNARRFARDHAGVVEFRLLQRAEDALHQAALVSLATTASVPHLADEGGWGRGSTVLHISLRDLRPETILRSVNLTDDVDHACRERTSLHLTEIQEGHREFVAGTLERALRGEGCRSVSDERPLVFSPFGLGILDLAVAALVLEWGNRDNVGFSVRGFSPRAAP
ncbi:MAG TPA: 2,3-diaminopropionate biosynthesis protein SbnB [Polyangiaceae bacterium]|nr:2,3-diaminopropionate biosynthesis protein SbnB [Polyangiaceae bacterium]